MLKLIIFDLGGVVTSPEVERLDYHVADFLGIDIDQLRSITSKYKSAVTKGEINLKEVYSRVVDELDLKAKPETVLDRHLKAYCNILSKFDQKVLSIIDRLKQRYNVVALVNAEPEVVPIARKLGLYDSFDRVYISCEMGMEKPDEKIYRTVLTDYDCAPQDAMFIDDKLENVRGAQQLGIKTIHYLPQTNLEEELKIHGVEL